MVNILFLPHAFPHAKLKTRTLELARELAKDSRFCVFVLSRSTSPLKDLKYGLCHCLSKTVSWKEDRLIYVKIPYIPGYFPGLYSYNRRLLGHLLRSYDIRVVINSFAHSLPMPLGRKIVVIYDLADDYAGFHKNPMVKAWISSYIRREARRADALTTVSLTLGEQIKKKGWRRDFIWLPNGVDAAPVPSLAEIDSLRGNLGLKDKIVIGHIGSQDRLSGLDFLLHVFNKARLVEPKLALMVVGPGSVAERLKTHYACDPNVVFIGPVDPEIISSYFLVTDVGVLPYAPVQSVHSRFPLRLAEFISARKVVVAWPFGDLPKLRLPNVILAERSIDAWVIALLRAKDLTWDSAWEDLREQFSSYHISEDLKDLIFKLLKSRSICQENIHK